MAGTAKEGICYSGVKKFWKYYKNNELGCYKRRQLHKILDTIDKRKRGHTRAAPQLLDQKSNNWGAVFYGKTQL